MAFTRLVTYDWPTLTWLGGCSETRPDGSIQETAGRCPVCASCRGRPSSATRDQWFSQSLASIGGRAQEAIDEANRAYQLDALSPIIGFAQGVAYSSDRQFDKAIELYKKVIADNPTFAPAQSGLALAYWGEHKYPQALQGFKTSAQFAGDKNYAEFAAALDAGFRSGGTCSMGGSGN